jgi:Cysteine-rich CWC
MRNESAVNNKCPICGSNNECGAEKETCWCFSIKIPPQVFEKIPPEFYKKSCVCKNCATQTPDNKIT